MLSVNGSGPQQMGIADMFKASNISPGGQIFSFQFSVFSLKRNSRISSLQRVRDGEVGFELLV
jgi:hypothetical protein